MIAGSPKSVVSSPVFLQSIASGGYSGFGASVSSGRANPKLVSRMLLGWLLPLVMAVLVIGAADVNAKESSKDDLHARLEPFTVNLAGPAQKYLQVEMTLSVANAEVGERVKAYMPAIRHQLILLLTSKDANALGTTEGKRKLLKEAKSAANNAIKVREGEAVTGVLFTSFIIQ